MAQLDPLLFFLRKAYEKLDIQCSFHSFFLIPKGPDVFEHPKSKIAKIPPFYECKYKSIFKASLVLSTIESHTQLLVGIVHQILGANVITFES